MEEPAEGQTTEEEYQPPEISPEHLQEQIELVRQLASAAPPVFREVPLPAWNPILSPLVVFGVLFLDKQPPALGKAKEEKAPAAIILAKNSFNKAAFNLLTATSETVAELTQNNIEGFDFQDWRPVKDDPPEAWIDLVVTRGSDGELVHLIWSVNTETERMTPLSQAARDLEASR